MMAQWHECKQKAPGAILFFRLGDFYEAFHEDAQLISKELDLTLTKRQEIPMAGVPFHMGEQYIDKLVAKGYRVAIAEQLEDPRQVKGIVKRDIVRIVTPGTLINSDLLQDKSHNYVACLAQVNQTFGLAYIDISTSKFGVAEFGECKTLLDELLRLSPKELLFSKKWKEKNSELIKEIKELVTPTFNFKEEWAFEHRHALETLLAHFKVASLDGFGLKAQVAAINAAGTLLAYLKEDLQLPTHQIQMIQSENHSHYMALDRTTQKNLELSSSLFSLLDETCTPMGARLLKEWLFHPLLDPFFIQERQQAIRWLLSPHDLISLLASIRDLERLIMRIETGFASPRDLSGLSLSLQQVPSIAERLQKTEETLLKEDRQALTGAEKIAALISDQLVECPPFRISEGAIFKKGAHPQLDELRALKEDSHGWIARYQTELRESTQIKSLKVGYTKAFGYYIETSRGASEKVPPHFQRKQTLVNNERYITEELKEFEYKILSAEERILSLEQDLFHELRKKVAAFAPQVRRMAAAIGRIDCLCALAKVAKKRHYICPTIDLSGRFEIENGRHPVIEAAMLQEHFIPNSLKLGETHPQLMLITGPNMAGKSTYLRQAALIVIMAQMGSFVPATSAHIGIVDKLFCRIGASDDLARGQSTFMVEMVETANILNNATSRSLVILDEIGRGTSTYDGISIAWAVAEYLLTTPGKTAKTLFATHYWELTELEKKMPGAANFHVAVHEKEKTIIFLRKIVAGSANKSYGIHVARIAGLPSSVVQRAEERLAELEKSGVRIKSSLKKKEQLELFT
ncbi:MAG TPA: DNA mismatch repair protein MutS [Rhabdochlamydiaceae bacterium]|nr:DNA mismatch repair protein MutS [Rhabdochlamydiaceae bacterium]